MAILRDVDGRVVTLAQGDRFADGQAILLEVKRLLIVLDHQGRRETVSIEELRSAKGQVAQQTMGRRPGSMAR